MDILKSVKFKCSVSSVLNNDIKQNGKQFLYDQREDTAWTSNEGDIQWINFDFEEEQSLSAFVVQFQGGFAAVKLTLEIQSFEEGTNSLFTEVFYPEDTNAEQRFQLKAFRNHVKSMKVIINESSDFYGRIILYKLKLLQ